MTMRTPQFHRLTACALTAALTGAISLPASAQSSSDDPQSRQRSRDSRAQRQLQVEPEGWVQVGVDYDNDGRFDAFETIFVYDLEVAKKRSADRQRDDRQRDDRQRDETRQRGGGQQGNSGRSESLGQRDEARGLQQWDERRYRSTDFRQPNRQESRSAIRRLSGEIREIRKLTMHDGDSKLVVARIRTDNDRTARVVLGYEEELSRLSLREGDEVEVRGVPTRLNDRPVLVAREVSSGNEAVRVQPNKRRGESQQQSNRR